MTMSPARRTSLLLRCTAVAALAAAAVGATQVPSADAAPGATGRAVDDGRTVIRPGRLERGAGPGVPVTIGTILLHEDRATDLDARSVQVLGTSGEDVVVAVWDSEGSRVERVTPDRQVTTVTPRTRGQLLLSTDGLRLLAAVPAPGGETRVVVRDAVTGERELVHRFAGSATVLDADGHQAVVATTEPDAVHLWDLAPEAEPTQVAGRSAYAASLGSDRLVTGRGDGGERFCTQVRRLSEPGHVSWRTCRRSVLSIEPSSGRLLTGPAFLDGPLGTVAVNTPRGRHLETFETVRGAHLGQLRWEDRDQVLAEVTGRRHVSIVRCDTAGACELASDVEDNPYAG